MALEPCPHCSKQFDHDNAGARQNHVDACAREKAKYQDAPQAEQPHPQGQPAQAQAPPSAAADPQPPQQGQLPAQQTQQQAQGGLPAQQTQEDIQQGLALGTQVISPMMSGDPTDRQVGKGRLMKTIAGALASAGQEMEEQAEQGRQRAREHAGQELQPSQQLPVCGDCGGQIPNMPASGEFPCPNCGIVLQA